MEDTRDFDAVDTQGTITGLVPGNIYTFQIQARTKVGYGQWMRKEQKMPILAPPEPDRNTYPIEVSRSMHTIAIMFSKNFFSDRNGKVLGYTIIVGEDYTKETRNDLYLPDWREVQHYSIWPPYQVKDLYDPFTNLHHVYPRAGLIFHFQVKGRFHNRN